MKTINGWRPISEYCREKYDWVLIMYSDGYYWCVPDVAEMRVDGYWYNRAGSLIDQNIFDVLLFFDMGQLEIKEKNENPEESESKKADWIWNTLSGCSQYGGAELFEKVEKALGFKLFCWQKSYIADGSFRCYGKTTAEILRELLTDIDGEPLDYTKMSATKKRGWYIREVISIKQKLNDAGISTRKVRLRGSES